MDPLITIGLIMTIMGLLVLILGVRRSVPNSLLWALFPIFHGLHEFTDYIAESNNPPSYIEPLEIFFSYGSSIFLLAASIEYNGAIPKPTGKILALFVMIFLTYFLIVLDSEFLEEIKEHTIHMGLLYSEPHRFFFGFFLPILSAIIIISNHLYLTSQVSQKKISIDPHERAVSWSAAILISIFSVFEGFDSDNPLFIETRAISLSIFIIIPLIFVLISKPGLQRLLIIAETGDLSYGYNFGSQTDVFSKGAESDLDNAVLTAGFLAAITGFSGQIGSHTPSLSIRSGEMYFTLQKINNQLYALQSLSFSKGVERAFLNFIKEFDSEKMLPKGNEARKSEDYVVTKTLILQTFKGFY